LPKTPILSQRNWFGDVDEIFFENHMPFSCFGREFFSEPLTWKLAYLHMHPLLPQNRKILGFPFQRNVVMMTMNCGITVGMAQAELDAPPPRPLRLPLLVQRRDAVMEVAKVVAFRGLPCNW